MEGSTFLQRAVSIYTGNVGSHEIVPASHIIIWDVASNLKYHLVSANQSQAISAVPTPATSDERSGILLKGNLFISIDFQSAASTRVRSSPQQLLVALLHPSQGERASLGVMVTLRFGNSATQVVSHFVTEVGVL